VRQPARLCTGCWQHSMVAEPALEQNAHHLRLTGRSRCRGRGIPYACERYH
jgi:hypothetical protein